MTDFSIFNFVMLKIVPILLIAIDLPCLLVVVFCEARVSKVSSAAEHFPGFYYISFFSSNLVIWVGNITD